MSLTYSTAVWNMCLNSSGLKLVALALADRADERGVCWPSVATVARTCDMDERSVRRHLAKLRRMQLIRAMPRFKDGFQRSNVYQFCELPESKQAEARFVTAGDATPDTTATPGMTTESSGGWHPGQGGADKDGTQNHQRESSMEPSIQQQQQQQQQLTRARRKELMSCPEPVLTAEATGAFLNHPERLTAEETWRYWGYLEQFLDGRKDFRREFPDFDPYGWADAAGTAAAGREERP